jgi:hypothetical protein
MPRVRDLPDFLIGLSVIGIAIYLFIEVSRTTAFIMLGAVIGGLLIVSYFFSARGVLQLKYHPLIQVLISRDVTHEKEILTQISWSEMRLHRAFYSLAKRWHHKPLVIFHRNQYVYVSSRVIGQIESVLREFSKKQEQQETTNISAAEREALKEIQLQYPFETRAEFDTIVTKVRDHVLKG